jgi:transmembrane sensor
VTLGPARRSLRLVRGEGRFSVAHEARPFVVAAGGAEVVAHGTEFVVRLAGGRTTVSLIAGSVDISYEDAGGGKGGRRIARLRPGERLMVEPPPAAPPAAAVQPGSRGAPAMLVFDDSPLSDAIAQANARGDPKIRLADPALASLRVTGAFRAGDTASLAASLAAAFGLQLGHAADGTLLLRRVREQPGVP